jgi:hypothetical protein
VYNVTLIDGIVVYFQAKEDEVKQLLCSADQQVASTQSEARVYSAMADTLGEAWRDLNAKLEYRRMLLDHSVAFHQSADDVSTDDTKL